MMRRSRRVAAALPPLALAALAFALYANALATRDPQTGRLRALQQFMLDDRMAIQHHALVFRPDGALRIPLTDYWAGRGDDPNLYRPVAVWSQHANARLSGWRRDRALPFRVTNVLLLWGVGCLAAAWFAAHLRHRAAAWLAAAVLVAHPANAELVGQIVGRADLLAVGGVLGFAALQARARCAGRWTPGASAAALVCAGVAFGSKETGLLLAPLAALQCALPPRAPAISARRTVRRTAALVGLPLALYAVGRIHAVGLWPHYTPVAANDLTGNPLRGLGFAERAPAALSLAWFYARQAVWPDLGVSQNPTVLPGWGDTDVWLGAGVAGLAAAAWAWTLARRHWLALPLGLALGQLLLVGNLLVPSGVYASGRLALPMTLAATAGLAVLCDRAADASRARRALAIAVWTCALLALAASVREVNRHWHDMQALMAAELERRPEHPVSWYLYGAALLEKGDSQAAVPWLERAVERRPDSVEARWVLARAYAGSGYLEGALDQYERIVERVPDDLDALLQIVAIQLKRGDLGAAEHFLVRAERLAPEQLGVMRAAAALAERRGRTEEARERYRALLERHPGFERAHRKLEALEPRSPAPGADP